MDLADLLAPEAVLADAPAASARDALEAAAHALARATGLAAPLIAESLAAREAEGSTGFGNGVALPHACLPGVVRETGAFVRLKRPVPFDSIDDLPVDLVFALLAPPGERASHLKSLARISRAMRVPGLLARLRGAANAAALHAVLTRRSR
ncbi:PTS sugar transporter subunit IIA [Thermaurantiacus sp.]